jgi:hypothetical protein
MSIDVVVNNALKPKWFEGVLDLNEIIQRYHPEEHTRIEYNAISGDKPSEYFKDGGAKLIVNVVNGTQSYRTTVHIPPSTSSYAKHAIDQYLKRLKIVLEAIK